MKTLKLFSSIFAMFLALVLLAGCNISQSFADKVNKAAEKGDHYTYAEVIEKLGKDNVIDLTGELFGYRGGVVIGVKGLSDKEELEKKFDEGKEVPGIVIVIENDKAIKAEYKTLSKSDLKLK